ncbi:hypothetical protein NSQ20_25540 [Paenibacillus sp. FSL K6-1122]|uniref:hypothetical protein n=1 Tax=Paenibacillus sp. FSL K6-1122 TaxID=2954512 RepID=UPI0030EE2496
MDSAWIAVVSALGASTLTFIGSLVTNIQKSRSDAKKDKENREWSLEDAERTEKKNKLESEFNIYNEFLRAVGELHYVREDQVGYYLFDLEQYRINVRPILFVKLHLLPYGIIEKIRGLDVASQKEELYESPEDWRDDLSIMFNTLVIEIEQQYQRIQ